MFCICIQLKLCVRVCIQRFYRRLFRAPRTVVLLVDVLLCSLVVATAAAAAAAAAALFRFDPDALATTTGGVGCCCVTTDGIAFDVLDVGATTMGAITVVAADGNAAAAIELPLLLLLLFAVAVVPLIITDVAAVAVDVAFFCANGFTMIDCCCCCSGCNGPAKFGFGSLMFTCSLKFIQNSPTLWISPFLPEYSVKQCLQIAA